jgi:hypothetical protein
MFYNLDYSKPPKKDVLYLECRIPFKIIIENNILINKKQLEMKKDRVKTFLQNLIEIFQKHLKKINIIEWVKVKRLLKCF